MTNQKIAIRRQIFICMDDEIEKIIKNTFDAIKPICENIYDVLGNVVEITIDIFKRYLYCSKNLKRSRLPRKTKKKYKKLGIYDIWKELSS